MDIVLLVKAVIMGVVEGLTEFLPISSTGHLILAGSLLGFDDDRAKVFDIAIQTGAILAVIIVYWQKIRDTVTALPTQPQAQRFALNVAIGFVPAVILGLLAGKAIKAHLFTPVVVATDTPTAACRSHRALRPRRGPREEAGEPGGGGREDRGRRLEAVAARPSSYIQARLYAPPRSAGAGRSVARIGAPRNTRAGAP